MLKLLSILFLSVSIAISANFSIDADDCARSAKKLKNYAEELESLEDEVESAESDYESNCGSYGYYTNDEYMCGLYGTYRTSYNDAIDNYNSGLEEVNYALKKVIRDCN